MDATRAEDVEKRPTRHSLSATSDDDPLNQAPVQRLHLPRQRLSILT